MRVEGAFMALNIVHVMWKSTSSNGWEYFDYVKGLGFKSYVCHLCVLCCY